MCTFAEVHFFQNWCKLEDIDSKSPFQWALRSSPSTHEFLKLDHFHKPHNDRGIPQIQPLMFNISSSSSTLPPIQPLGGPPHIPTIWPPFQPPLGPPIPPMAFFANTVDSPINLRGALHDLPKNPEKFFPRFIYGETWTFEDHVIVFKEICVQSNLSHSKPFYPNDSIDLECLDVSLELPIYGVQESIFEE